MKRDLRIGTRGSKLALWQANWVAGELKKAHPNLNPTLIPIKTTGDLMPDAPLNQAGGKDLFMKEIENELLAGNIDIAVHSMKDVPTKLPKGLVIGAILKREDPRDVLISSKGDLSQLPAGSHVGTSSFRRISQLKRARPDLQFIEMRGNVDTRLEKLKRGQYDAIVLAIAGLKRLGITPPNHHLLDIVPAPGQGAVGVELRASDAQLLKLLQSVNDAPTQQCVDAEREFLSLLEANCRLPLGCHVTLNESQARIHAFVGDLKAQKAVTRELSVAISDLTKSIQPLADEMLQAGARDILKELSV